MMKDIQVLLLLFLTFLSAQSRSVLANEVDSSYRFSLNGEWKFRTDPYAIGIDSGWYKNGHSLAQWDHIQVPGNWDVRNEYADYAGRAWYRTTIWAEEDWKDKNIRLFFQSVYYEARVWINGQEVGENHLGFLPFFFDINRYLQFGQKNTLVVLVDNTFKRGAMWNWGGIRRPVYLEITDKSRLAYQHVTAMPDLNRGSAQIAIDFDVNNLGKSDDNLRVEWEISNDQQAIWRDTPQAAFALSGGERKQLHLATTLPSSKVQLWHFNHPYLYTSKVKLYRGNTLIHQINARFGIRKISIEGEQVKLNGETIRLVGFNLVADDRTTGNTLPLWRIMEDVDLMKAMGANMARLSHQPLPQEFLDYLDEKGMLIFEEVALWGKDAMVDPNHPIPKEWLSRMIKDQHNHPCIIGWSVGNEIGYTTVNPKVMDYVQGAIQQAKQEDPNRMAVYVSHSADKQQIDPAQFSDMILLNKYDKWGINADKVHQNQPGKPIFYSEYGAGITSEDPNLGKIDAKKMLDAMRNKPYLMGASLWTFNDYRSAFTGTPPSENRSWGIVNVFRQKKRAYFDFRREYAPLKKLQMQDKGKVHIVPRDKLDLPAYNLENYVLVWEAKDKQGNLLDGGFSKLPIIKPGDAAINLDLKWQKTSDQFSTVKLSLLDPQGYAVLDTLTYFVEPEQPVIIKTSADANTIRVLFNRHPSARAWKARYSNETETRETPETIDDFVEIPALSQGKTYHVELIAVNNYGESIPTASQAVRTSEKELPPVIWGIEAADRGCFIAYSVDPKDYVYQVQYGTKSGDNGHFRTIQVNTSGVCHIPGLQNGQTYYIRMRRLMQWGFASEWTPELQIVPGNHAQAPRPFGVLRKGKEALLIFNPAEKAIAYQVQYIDKETKDAKTMSVNASQIHYISIKGLNEKHAYDFKIATQRDSQLSTFAPFHKKIVLDNR